MVCCEYLRYYVGKIFDLYKLFLFFIMYLIFIFVWGGNLYVYRLFFVYEFWVDWFFLVSEGIEICVICLLLLEVWVVICVNFIVYYV